jgi:hypothetical protein
MSLEAISEEIGGGLPLLPMFNHLPDRYQGYGSGTNTEEDNDDDEVATININNEMKSENYMRKTQEQTAEDIAVAAIAHIGGPVTLLGHSHGGFVFTNPAYTNPASLDLFTLLPLPS